MQAKGDARFSDVVLGVCPNWHEFERQYVPDFVIRLTNGVHLILKTKGHDPLEDVKAQAARRWVDAVNADGAFGERRYEIVHEMASVGALIDGEATSTTAVPQV